MFVPAIKFVGPNGTYPKALVILKSVKSFESKGVYPRAEVISDDDKEKEAVRFDNPSLVNVRVLIVEPESENEIDVT